MLCRSTRRDHPSSVFDPAEPSKGARGQLTVPVASLRTGIPPRDEHLHGSDWLDASAQPDIRFVIDSVTDVRVVKAAGGARSYDLTLGGSLSLHGQTRRIEAPARVTYMTETEQTRMRLPGNLLAGRTSFTVSLKDLRWARDAGGGSEGLGHDHDRRQFLRQRQEGRDVVERPSGLDRIQGHEQVVQRFRQRRM
jgi:hypothetical protein